MHVAIITAGGAGMFCGSCMHDNTLARALQAQGTEVTLVPTYTPIRVDEENVSTQEVFLGGINVYMDSRVPFWSRMPRVLKKWLDAPWIIRLATSFGVSNDAAELGDLTIAMLQGELGPQKSEVDELVRFLADDLQPDVIVFSNALLSGVVRTLRNQFSGPILCTLQGDDIFLEALREPWKSQAMDLIQQRCVDFDGFLVHSQYYLEFMADYLKLPRDVMYHVPLGIDFDGFEKRTDADANSMFTVGYFARICKEKGLRELVEAFQKFEKDCDFPVRLRVAGFCGDKKYLDDVLKSAEQLSHFDYVPDIPDRTAKAEFLRSLDVLSVPTVYREPKGLYVLEALACGVPVAQPEHGSFPELVHATAGGLLHPPGSAGALAGSLHRLATNKEERAEFANNGFQHVREKFSCEVMARDTLAVLQAAVEKRENSAQTLANEIQSPT